MLIYDDVYEWEGFGGLLQLGRGKCRLRIFDQQSDKNQGVAYMRPVIVVVNDVAGSPMSVRSCSSHIATRVSAEFEIDPHRMLFVEYYPQSQYGQQEEHTIPERLDAVEFIWHDDKAMHPKWRTLKPPMLETVRELIHPAKSSF